MAKRVSKHANRRGWRPARRDRMRVLDLFAGIGGFSLGLEWAGPFETVAFCEIDADCKKRLSSRWPGVPIYDDIKEVTAERLRADGILADTAWIQQRRQEQRTEQQRIGKCSESQPLADAIVRSNEQSEPQPSKREISRSDAQGVDVITGGFPCQDLSNAGKGAGIEAERSGLWSELVRLIGEVRPRYAVIENVSALLSGSDVTWFCQCGWVGTAGVTIYSGEELPELYVCPTCARDLDHATTRHHRAYWFSRVLADLAAIGFDAEGHCISAAHLGAPHIRDRVWIIAYPQYPNTHSTGSDREEMHQHGSPELQDEQKRVPGSVRRPLPDTNQQGPQGYGRLCERAGQLTARQGGRSKPGVWLPEPAVCGMADGLPDWMDGYLGRIAPDVPDRVARLRALGGAIVPLHAELIGLAILDLEERRK